MKISTVVIGMIMVSLAVVIFGSFMAEINDRYGVTYNDSKFGVNSYYNQLSNLTNETAKIVDATKIEENPNTLDVIGGYIRQALGAIKITFTSFGVFFGLTNQAFIDLPLGNVGGYIKSALIAMFIVAVLIAGFVSAILKWRI